MALTTPLSDIPISYDPAFISQQTSDAMFAKLRDELSWIRHPNVPRSEYYVNTFDVPYTYGRGAGVRTYQPQPMHAVIAILKELVGWTASSKFEAIFLNRYDDQRDQLGWHADDSPEMDDDRPIAIVTFGVARDIMFRRRPALAEKLSMSDALMFSQTGERAWVEEETPVHRLNLAHGSLCLMAAGMQDTHQHRIPKASFQCGQRISLTFRGYKPKA